MRKLTVQFRFPHALRPFTVMEPWCMQNLKFLWVFSFQILFQQNNIVKLNRHIKFSFMVFMNVKFIESTRLSYEHSLVSCQSHVWLGRLILEVHKVLKSPDLINESKTGFRMLLRPWKWWYHLLQCCHGILPRMSCNCSEDWCMATGQRDQTWLSKRLFPFQSLASMV